MRLRPDLEDALRTLPGVQAVSVVTSGDGKPTEVHVLATPGKAPKQVVRDVQSVAMAGFDVDLDHRIVSVVQIEQRGGPANGLSLVPDDGTDGVAGVPAPDGSGPADPGTPRPLVGRIALSTTGTGASATVSVRLGEDEFVGEVEGPATAPARPRLVAEATVQALSELVGSACEVEAAQVTGAGQREVAVVVLSLAVPRVGLQVLTGSALVRQHPEDAVVRAVLDALNRHLAG
ncbi:hypothetical protein GCM10027446_29460 [Angustibacter peucedani]